VHRKLSHTSAECPDATRHSSALLETVVHRCTAHAPHWLHALARLQSATLQRVRFSGNCARQTLAALCRWTFRTALRRCRSALTQGWWRGTVWRSRGAVTEGSSQATLSGSIPTLSVLLSCAIPSSTCRSWCTCGPTMPGAHEMCTRGACIPCIPGQLRLAAPLRALRLPSPALSLQCFCLAGAVPCAP
jgi:hypothetical protein